MIPIKDLVSYTVHIICTPAAVWLYNERRILKEVLEDGLDRRHDMLNPITIVNDINLAVGAITKVQSALPQIQKTVNDIKQAVADKSDTTKLDLDFVNLIADIQADLANVANLFPTAPVTTPVPAIPVPPVTPLA